jgi:hypothetical protein
MGSHHPFGYLKHKLWPKPRSGIKLPIWFPTIKSQELPWFSYLQVACHIPLERSQQDLQLCFRLYFNRRFTQKFMSLQNHKSPNFENFGTPNFGVPRQNDIWVQAMWPGTKNIIKGKVVASPSLNNGESCKSVFVCGLSVHQECYNCALTNLLFGLCKLVCIVDPLVTCPSPHSKAPTHPSTPKCCEPRNIPQLLILSLYSPWIHSWVYQGAWGCVNNHIIITQYFTNVEI